MRAQIITAYGGIEVFKPADLPIPKIKPGHVLVKLAATSVNPVDYKLRKGGAGMTHDLPAVLHGDFSGTVAAVGPGVLGFSAGDEVYGCSGGMRGTEGGALAEYLLADARLMAPAPRALSLIEAAALPLVAITAWEGLVDKARLESNQTVLVHGGVGGVGHVAIQLARALGARVFATVSSTEKASMARQLGAEATANYKEESVADYVRRLTDGRGFDVVFDSLGGANLTQSFAAARLNGQIVSTVTNTADMAPMHARGLSLHAVFMPIAMLHDVDRAHHGFILRRIADLVDARKLRPLIDPVRFSLEDIGKAHARLESGKATGKIVVTI